MRNKVIRRRVLVVFFCILAALAVGIGLFVGARAVNASTGDAGHTGGSHAGNDAGAVVVHWDIKDMGSSADAAISEIETTGGNWNSGERENVIRDFNNAVADCQRNGAANGKGCNNPKIVAMGWVDYASWHFSRVSIREANGGRDEWLARGLGDVPVGGMPGLTTGYSAGPGSDSITAAVQRQEGNTVVIVVMADWQYNVKGWRQNWSDNPRADVKSKGHDETAVLSACPAYYRITSNGYDGYVKDMNGNDKTLKTPYGDLWDALAANKAYWTSYTDDYGQKTYGERFGSFHPEDYPEYPIDPDSAIAKANAAIRAAHDRACQNTYVMKIDYTLDKDGGAPGKEMNQQFKRGGQYKITKHERNATITTTQLVLEYWKRHVNWRQFEGWTECTAGEPGCEHIGEGRPGTPGGLIADPYGSGKWGFYNSVGPWTGASQGEARAAVRNGGKIDGRPLSGVFNENDRQIGIGRPSPVTWLGDGEAEFNFGSAGGMIDGSHYHAVANNLQSYVAIAMQDFVHINCNQKDFNSFADWVRGQGVLDESSVQSTRNNGYFNTTVMQSDEHGRPVQQKLGRILITLGGWDAVNPGSPKPGRFDIKYAQASGEDAGNIDPVYTKECPYDCVADANVVKGNIRDAGANDDNKAKDSYGIQAWANDSKGEDSPEKVKAGKSTNTADMIFFRNNEWNYFHTDKWVPKSEDGITYNGSPATTTTIVRDIKGTPWVTPDEKNLLTEMHASTDGGASYKRIFDTDDPKTANSYDESAVLSQWSNGKKDSATEPFNARASYKILGDATDFRIKSAWATEEGRPLNFNIKWEYQTTNTVPVLDDWKIDGTGTPTGNTTKITLRNEQQTVDGKCDSQYHNKDQAYPDHEQDTQKWTGTGVKDNPDSKYYGPDPMKGWFSVTFVRATGE